MLGSLNQLTICIGILGALVVNVVLPPDAWRIMFWLATIPAALLAFGEDAAERLTTVCRFLANLVTPTLITHRNLSMLLHSLQPESFSLPSAHAGLLFVPESPRWLFANDRNMEAQNAAVRLWGPAGPALLSEGGLLALCIADVLHNDRLESSARGSGGSRGRSVGLSASSESAPAPPLQVEQAREAARGRPSRACCGC